MIKRIPAVCVFLIAIVVPAAIGHAPGAEPPAASTGTLPASQHIRVAVFDGAGVGRSESDVVADLKACLQLQVSRITTQTILAGGLKDVDVVVFPGGSGGGQGRNLGDPGRECVREFVRSGGGYVGICAGAYLATADYDWSLHILDAKVLDRKHWARGFGNVKLTMHPAQDDSLGFPSDTPQVYYHQGPILAPADLEAIPDYEEWATFQTEVRRKGVPGGVMPGRTAIAAGRYGDGRVLAISPHPEKTDGLDHVLPKAVQWAATR